jgi:hypothetical protein
MEVAFRVKGRRRSSFRVVLQSLRPQITYERRPVRCKVLHLWLYVCNDATEVLASCFKKTG